MDNGVRIRTLWKARAGLVTVVEEEGSGLSNTPNLFVPFFTTKPRGSGVGPMLYRQIAEGRGGALGLKNRKAPATDGNHLCQVSQQQDHAIHLASVMDSMEEAQWRAGLLKRPGAFSAMRNEFHPEAAQAVLENGAS